MSQKWAESRVLVTGGAGLIGSALVWALNKRRCTSIVIADFPASAAKQRNLAPLQFREFVQPEILAERAERGYFCEFDFIFHLGACSSTTETDEDYLRENNYEYTRTLAAAALEAGTRFVYASSAATYGSACSGTGDFPYDNLETLEPLNPYGIWKHLFDLEARQQGWLDHIVGLKFFNVFGPNEYHKGDMRSVVSKSYHQILETGTIQLFRSYHPEFADGEQKRDFLYVKDAVEMTLHLAANSTASGLFNIGSGEAHSWNELARAVFWAMGRRPQIEYVDMPLAIRGKYQYFTQAQINRLRQFGYSKPITPLTAAVYDYVVHYLVPEKVLGQEATRSDQ